MTEALETHLRNQTERSRRFFWHRLRWRVVLSYLPENTHFELIDVGAGAGLVGYYLSRDRRVAKYRFIEPISSIRKGLRDQYGVASDAADEENYRSADFVCLLDVLEHQQNDQEFISTLVSKMKPGAMLFVTVPANEKLWSQWDVALGHFRRYDKTSLLDCVRGLPVEVRETSFLFPEMLPLGLARAKRRRLEPTSQISENAEFPDLPTVVNDVLFYVGTLSLALRRHWRSGTSLFMVLVVTD